MIAPLAEKKLLQATIALACLVPISAGLAGMLRGAGLLGGGSIDLDSHVRYLSGLLLGAGLGFLSTVPAIERHGARFGVLTFLVVLGGIGRLLGILEVGMPSLPMKLALVMELVVTPLLWLWQRRITRRLPA